MIVGAQITILDGHFEKIQKMPPKAMFLRESAPWSEMLSLTNCGKNGKMSAMVSQWEQLTAVSNLERQLKRIAR